MSGKNHRPFGVADQFDSVLEAGVVHAQQYYAHPQNAFWRITGELVGFDPAADYRARAGALLKGGIGLWDVLHTCQREGSLDSAIAPDTMTANDFDGLFAQQVAGISAYAFWDESVYAELGGYRSARRARRCAGRSESNTERLAR